VIWRRGWDSNQCWILKTKNLTDFGFLTIRRIRTKALEIRADPRNQPTAANRHEDGREIGAGRWRTSSTAIVPWPAMTIGSSKG
jgi:hypothetical protein